MNRKASCSIFLAFSKVKNLFGGPSLVGPQTLGLDFEEGQTGAILRNQINLSGAGSPVSAYDVPAQWPQVYQGQPLPPRSPETGPILELRGADRKIRIQPNSNAIRFPSPCSFTITNTNTCWKCEVPGFKILLLCKRFNVVGTYVVPLVTGTASESLGGSRSAYLSGRVR